MIDIWSSLSSFIFCLKHSIWSKLFIYTHRFGLLVLLLICVLMLFLSLQILVQVIPLHLPAGDTSTERTVHIDGTPEQIESAKQLVIEVTSEVRLLSLIVCIHDIWNCFALLCLSALFRLLLVHSVYYLVL